MDNPVVLALFDGLSAAGYAPLCFNWRGVGRSPGTPSGRIEDAETDYRSALEALAKHRSEAGLSDAGVLAAGYSFGAATALRVALDEDARIQRLTLVAPPLAMIDPRALASLEQPVHVVVGESDAYAPLAALNDAFSEVRDLTIDVVPDADHFFGSEIWIEKLEELVRSALV